MQKDNESTKNLSQAEKALVTLLMRLEVIKTCRDDKSFLTNHKSSIQCFSQNPVSSAIDKQVSDISDQEKTHSDLIKEDINALRKQFHSERWSITEFEKVFRQKLMQRHNVQQIKTLCAKMVIPLTEAEQKEMSATIDINNCSSANSTPINCKSLTSSNQNSTLKKRNYQEYLDIIEQEEKEITQFKDKVESSSSSSHQTEEEPEESQKRQKVEEPEGETPVAKSSDSSSEQTETEEKTETVEETTPPKEQEQSSESVQIIDEEIKEVKISLGSSLNNSQARELKQNLDLDVGGCNEFSFNGPGPEPKKTKKS